jgi:hypothetical protein
MPAADARSALRPGADKSKEQTEGSSGGGHAGEIGEKRKEGKEKQEVAFFEKKAPQKNFVTFTRDVATSPGRKLLKVFCGAFLQKSDLFLFLALLAYRVPRCDFFSHIEGLPGTQHGPMAVAPWQGRGQGLGCVAAFIGGLGRACA